MSLVCQTHSSQAPGVQVRGRSTMRTLSPVSLDYPQYSSESSLQLIQMDLLAADVSVFLSAYREHPFWIGKKTTHKQHCTFKYFFLLKGKQVLEHFTHLRAWFFQCK